jgi:hypothetical protein
VSPVKYELRFYIPEDGIHHSHRRESLKSYIRILIFVINPCGKTDCGSFEENIT